MSIIYKGLNPKHHYGLCILTINGELITANGKHFQAIQIPTPHGRIIDESDLTDELTELNDLNLESLAPTILEAEE